MEDLKKNLAILAKHSFWILSGLVLLLSTVFFYLTRSSLDESIESRKSALKSTFGSIQTVESKVATHPNEHSHKEMERRLEGLKQDVDKAWDFQYSRQKEFLTWPTEAFFQAKTHEIFDGLRPFESVVPFPLPDKPTPPIDQITRNDRSVYKNYIAPEFPALARRIGSTWKYKIESMSTSPGQGFGPPGGPGGFGPPGGTSGGFAPPGFGGGSSTANAPQDTRDLVRWSEASQKALASAVLPWFERTEPPNIHEIYYAQEDIWILRGLMDIIAQTNAGANENFQAIVKEIEWIRTGPRASRDAGTLYKSAAPSAGGMGGMGGMFGGGGPPSGYAGGGGGGPPAGYGTGPGKGSGGGGGMTRAAVQVDPADGRYVGADLKPLTGAQLRTAMKERSKDAVAKRVQVRMRLKVDERFGKLITECGNGKMMLEVLQVRYNTDPAPELALGGGPARSGGDGETSGPPGGAANMGTGGGTASLGDGEGGTGPGFGMSPLSGTTSAGEVSLEIYGLIYLFNPMSNLADKQLAASDSTGAPAIANGGSGTDNKPTVRDEPETPPATNTPEPANVPSDADAQQASPSGETPDDPNATPQPEPDSTSTGDEPPPTPPAEPPATEGGGGG
jgi:hypothetical protein